MSFQTAVQQAVSFDLLCHFAIVRNCWNSLNCISVLGILPVKKASINCLLGRVVIRWEDESMKWACTLFCKSVVVYAVSLMINCLFCHHRQQLAHVLETGWWISLLCKTSRNYYLLEKLKRHEPGSVLVQPVPTVGEDGLKSLGKLQPRRQDSMF